MGKKTKDFDEFFKERKQEKLTFKMFGEVHELSPVLPASVPLRLIRLEKVHGSMDDVPESEVMDLSASIFGQDLLTKLCDKGLDVEQLGHLIKWAMAIYTGREVAEDEESEVLEAGNEADPQSQ